MSGFVHGYLQLLPAASALPGLVDAAALMTVEINVGGRTYAWSGVQLDVTHDGQWVVMLNASALVAATAPVGAEKAAGVPPPVEAPPQAPNLPSNPRMEPKS